MSKSEKEEIDIFCYNINKAGFYINNNNYKDIISIVINASKQLGLYNVETKSFYLLIKELNKEIHYNDLIILTAKLCNKYLTIDINKAIKKELKEEDIIINQQLRQTKTFSDVLDEHYKERLVKW